MSYSNYSTYLKYKNCCRPIEDTGPPGPAGPTGPAATIDISGSKGEILYFSETDNLVSTDNVFIQEANVTINNNLVVTGTTYLNNTLEVTGNVIINGNLSMNDQFINDVSGIYFSDGTYIGHGSSFDITTSERLDISAAAGVTVTGNLSVKNAATFQSDTTITGNLTINGATTIDNTLQVTGNVIINGNLSMSDQFINDVSGIFFSDGTYIGLGSSFDITTSETLDISAAAGVTVNGNLTVNDATTVNKTLNVVGNTTLENLFVNGSINNLIEISGNTIQPIISEYVNLGYDESGSSNDKRFNLGFFNKIETRTAIIVGNLTMDGSFINDVSGIYFSDGTYIGHGTSFDITTSETLDISAAGGINLNTDVTINSNITINSNLTANTINTQRLLFPSGNYIDDNQGVGQLYVNGNTIINGNLSMNNNYINHVSGIIFTQGNLLFSDFSSVNQSIQLPSSQGQPISLERKTLFYDPNFNSNIPDNSSFIIDFSGSTIFNQLKLNVNGNIIEPSPDISGQYVEIYANFDVSSNTNPAKTFSLDISSVSGASFLETIDVRSISKRGRFYLTFGPHIFIPSQWENTTGFNFVIDNTGSNSSFFINSYKLMFKSYFM